MNSSLQADALDCPTAEELRRFLDGESCPQAAALERHLLGCRRCLERAPGLPADDALVEAMRTSPTVHREPAVETILDKLLRRLPGEGPSVPVAPPEGANANAMPDLLRQGPASATPAPRGVAAGPRSAATAGLAAFPFLAPPQQTDEIGRLGRYRVLEALGAGGMGVVFRAHDPVLDREVALKVVKPALAADAQARERFLREARAAAAVEHEHVVTIHEAGADGGVAFLAMPLLRGEPLQVRLGREGRLPEVEVLRIGRELAEGLAAVHASGLIHRDVKPANVWLEGARGKVKVLDFGLVRPERDPAGMTQLGVVMGTPAYMAPEQARGEAVDARADLFSLGCVLYELCTGRQAFGGGNVLAILTAVCAEQPALPHEVVPEVPRELSGLVMRLLAKERGERPASAQAVVEALRALENGGVTAPLPRQRRRLPSGRWRALAGLGAVAAALLAVVVITVETPDGKKTKITVENGTVEIDPKTDKITITPLPESGSKGQDKKSVLGPPRIASSPALEALTEKQAEEAARYRQPAEVVAVLGDPTRRHDWGVSGVAFSPDGKWVASVGSHKDPTVRLYESATMRLRTVLEGPPEGPHAVAFAPDGKTLAASGYGISLWDLSGPKVRPRQAPALPPGRHVGSLAFTPDSKALVTGDNASMVILWDLSGTAPSRRTLAGHTDNVLAVAVAPDGRALASAGGDGTVRLWRLDAPPGKEAEVLGKHTKAAQCVAFSPDGKLLASGGADGQVQVWGLTAAPRLRGAYTAGWQVCALAFSPDRPRLACGGGTNPLPGSLVLLDVSGGAPDLDVVLTGHMHPVKALAFSPDGKTLVSGSDDRTVVAWDVSAPRPRERVGPAGHRGGLVGLAFSTDGKTLATTSTRALWLWDWAGPKTSERARVACPYDGGCGVALTGTRALAPGGPRAATHLWRLAGGRPEGPPTELAGKPTLGTYTLALSRDGEWLATGDGLGNLELWDMSAERPMQRAALRGHRDCAATMAFTPDGKTLATGSWDKTAKLWDVSAAGLRERAELKGHPNPVDAVAVSPNGRTLATGGWDGEVLLWDLTQPRPEKPTAVLRKHTGRVGSLAFSPDGKSLASAGYGEERRALVWDRPTGKLRHQFNFPAAVAHIAYAPDGRHLLTGHVSGVVYVLRLPGR